MSCVLKVSIIHMPEHDEYVKHVKASTCVRSHYRASCGHRRINAATAAVTSKEQQQQQQPLPQIKNDHTLNVESKSLHVPKGTFDLALTHTKLAVCNIFRMHFSCGNRRNRRTKTTQETPLHRQSYADNFHSEYQQMYAHTRYG